MLDLTTMRHKEHVIPATASLDEKLNWLCKFGVPGVSRFPKGWWARIEMHVSSQGTKFQVDSEMTHATPSSAVNELIARMLQTLKDLGVAP